MLQNDRVGNLICKLRKERNLTQKQLADKLHISDKTVSKWERGQGLPDISLVSELTDLLGADLKSLLEGDMAPNDFVNGNMKNAKYYVCPTCHNITVCTGEAKIICCSKELKAQIMKKALEKEKLCVQAIERDWYITSDHPMTKEHYISFIAFVTGDKIQIVKQYPEWNLSVRIPQMGHGMLLWYCIEHGLFYQLI